MTKDFTLAIAGAASALGNEVLRSLEERSFPVGSLRLFDSAEHDGDFIEFNDSGVIIETLNHDSFAGIDLVFFCTDSGRAREFCPLAAASDAVCIDLSGAWRLAGDVPLVIPEVNPEALAAFGKRRIVANPDAATLLMATPLKPLHDVVELKRIVATLLLSVSGSGAEAIDALRNECGELLNGRPVTPSVYPHQIAFNCLPQSGAFNTAGATVEEQDLAEQLRKILAVSHLGVSVTLVRLPIFYGDSAAINIETEHPLSVTAARELLERAPGCALVDDPAESAYPMPVDAAGQDAVQVGRLRPDSSVAHGLTLWACADNLRKEATNAVQIAELLVARHL